MFICSKNGDKMTEDEKAKSEKLSLELRRKISKAGNDFFESLSNHPDIQNIAGEFLALNESWCTCHQGTFGFDHIMKNGFTDNQISFIKRLKKQTEIQEKILESKVRHEKIKSDLSIPKGEIIEFDTFDEFPKGFEEITVHMSQEINSSYNKKKSWRPEWRPSIVVKAYYKSDKDNLCCVPFGIKNIDGCLFKIENNGIMGSMTGYGSDTCIEIQDVSRIIGSYSQYNSAERDFNTGRITILRKEKTNKKL